MKKQAALALMVPLALACGADDPAGPNGGPPVVDEGYAFVYSPPAGAPAITSMSVPGSFNGWNQNATAMEEQPDGSWRVVVDLDSTVTHEYKFFINGAWVNDMCNDATWGHAGSGYVVHLDADGCSPDGYGGQNAAIILGDPGLGFSHVATQPLYVSIADDQLSVRFRARSGQVQAAMVIAGADTTSAHLQLTSGLQETWRASLPTSTTGYSIVVETADGEQQFGPYSVPADPFSSVGWVSDAVGYQIFTERFWNGDPSNDSLTVQTDERHYVSPGVGTAVPVLAPSWDAPPNGSHCCHQYYGGDLQGIIDRMQHLEDLGVTLIYLNPIFHAGSAHGYDIFDYLQVAPEFGDSTTLRALLDAAHGRGMKVMWDFVPNHVGVGHWAFQDAALTGPTSPYWDWFNFHPDAGDVRIGNGNDYDGWWGFGSLPELQTHVPEVFDHLIEVAEYWTRFGFDGIRVDVPQDIQNRAQFFPAFRAAAKGIDPDVYLVGEIWERDVSWLQGDQFDALMNYTMGRDVVEQYAKGAMSASAAAQSMAQLYADYPEAAAGMLFNVISTHDTARLLSLLGGGELGGTPTSAALARQRLASAILFALPGVPVTWQGDECAFLGSADGSEHRARFPLQWDDCDAAMKAHYAQLADLKHSLAALGSTVIRSPGATGEVLWFRRGEPGAGEVFAAFNNSGAIRSAPLPAGSWTDAVTGEVLSTSVPVSSYGWRYLRRN